MGRRGRHLSRLLEKSREAEEAADAAGRGVGGAVGSGRLGSMVKHHDLPRFRPGQSNLYQHVLRPDR